MQSNFGGREQENDAEKTGLLGAHKRGFCKLTGQRPGGEGIFSGDVGQAPRVRRPVVAAHPPAVHGKEAVRAAAARD